MEFTTNLMGRLRDFATEELLSRTGLQQRPSTFWRVLPAVGLFAGGVVFGLGIGLLFAPKSGADTRAAIRRGASKVGSRAQEIYGNVTHHADASTGESPTPVEQPSANGGTPHAGRQSGSVAGADGKAS